MATKNYALKADARDAAGKGAARALRRQDMVPGVIYGDGKAPVMITLPSKEINLEYRKGHLMNSLCDLTVGSEKHLVLARDVQLHVLKGTIEHIDYLRVTPKTRIAIEVPLHFINHEECQGLKDKGVLNTVLHSIELLCQVTSMPEYIEVDLTPFGIGDAIKLSHIKLPEGTKPAVAGRDFTLATITEQPAYEEFPVAAPAAEGEAAAGEGAAAGEAKEGEAKAEGDKKDKD